MCGKMLIMKHVSHLSTDKKGKKPENMPKCIPIYTNQLNPTNIIDGCQVIMEILADKKTTVAQNAAMQYG